MTERVSVGVVWLGFPLTAARPRPGIVDPLIRAAILADLALGGALADVGGGLEVDTTVTGFGPADRLLQGVVADPSRPLGWWLIHAPVSVRDLADVLIQDGRWTRHGMGRHFRESNPSVRETEISRIDAAVRSGVATPVEAVTAALLDVLPRRHEASAFDATTALTQWGAAAWIVPDLLIALARRQALIQAAGRDAQSAQSATFIV